MVGARDDVFLAARGEASRPLSAAVVCSECEWAHKRGRVRVKRGRVESRRPATDDRKEGVR